MDNISIEQSERAPGVDFNFENSTFSLKGESYPEDVTAFYGPLLDGLEKHFEDLKGTKVSFTFDLVYFNSSTAKILMGLFDMLDEAAEDNDVTVTWNYEVDDDNMEEMGEEFGEDLEKATFILNEVAIP
ncbi:MAG: Fe-S oxidoreductase [Rhodospirillaceae bacterium]|nr:MAG: Fe-S oxidoreductase [Rhodospirillaceae bacterium]